MPKRHKLKKRQKSGRKGCPTVGKRRTKGGAVRGSEGERGLNVKRSDTHTKEDAGGKGCSKKEERA